MANLCLENTQFLNERTISESELIMNEFANIDKMIQSICEFKIGKEEYELNPNWKTHVKSLSKTCMKSFGLKLEELKNTIIEKIKMIIAKAKTTIIDIMSKAKTTKKAEKDKEEDIEGFDRYLYMSSLNYSNLLLSNIYNGLSGNLSIMIGDVAHNVYSNMISNVKNNTRNKTYSSETEIANDLYDTKLFGKSVFGKKLIKDGMTIDEAVKQNMLGESTKLKISYLCADTEETSKTPVSKYIDKMRESINKFEADANKIRGRKIDFIFRGIEPRNEEEYNEECFKIAIQDMISVIRTMFNILNIASKYFYTSIIGFYTKVCMKAVTNGYEFINISHCYDF